MSTSRQSIILSKRLGSAFLASLTFVLVATTLAGCVMPLPASDLTQLTQSSSDEPVNTPLVVGSAPLSPGVVIYEGEEAKSLEEAQERVSFQIAVPGVAPGDYKLTWVGTSPADFKGEAEGQFVRLVYSDGKHYILVAQWPNKPPDPAGYTDEALAQIHHQRITVRDYPGMGHGAITVETPIAVVDGKTVSMTYEVPANMRWWPPGQERDIWTPDDLSITLEDLIAMAESMEPAQ